MDRWRYIRKVGDTLGRYFLSKARLLFFAKISDSRDRHYAACDRIMLAISNRSIMKGSVRPIEFYVRHSYSWGSLPSSGACWITRSVHKNLTGSNINHNSLRSKERHGFILENLLKCHCCSLDLTGSNINHNPLRSKERHCFILEQLLKHNT